MIEFISVVIILVIIYIVLTCCKQSSTHSSESYAPIKPSKLTSSKYRSPIRSAAAKKGGVRINGNHNKIVYNKNSFNNDRYDDYTPTYSSSRPWRYWTNYVYPSMYQNYPTSYASYYPYGYYPMAYGLAGDGYYTDPYDYTASVYPPGGVCWARIGIEDAFGPYTAGVMGKQAWLDWGGRNGFDKIALNSQSVTNDHAIASYVGMCRPDQQVPPGAPYMMYNSTPQYY
jgi:hypothetical protein